MPLSRMIGVIDHDSTAVGYNPEVLAGIQINRGDATIWGFEERIALRAVGSRQNVKLLVIVQLSGDRLVIEGTYQMFDSGSKAVPSQFVPPNQPGRKIVGWCATGVYIGP